MLTSSSFKWLFNFSSNLKVSNNNYVLPRLSLNFDSLLILDLSHNKLTPDASQDTFIFNFSSKTQKLYMRNCSLLDRNIPLPSVSNTKMLSSLGFLDISFNMLKSSVIFHWLFDFTINLHRLHLSNNMLQGPIPDNFGNKINSLKYLDLSYNKLQGDIPTSFGNISTLQFLSLSQNELNGKIPKSIGLLSMLEYLILNNNSLQGKINESHFASLSNLKRLELSYNSLALKFGTSWVPPFQLFRLELASCRLGPSFPSWLQTQSYLLSLNISNAGIVDSVPVWFCHMSRNMYALNLSCNNFVGILPSEICYLSQIKLLDLSENHISDQIPKCLHNFTAMAAIRMNMTLSDKLSHNYDNNIAGSRYDYYIPLMWKCVEDAFKNPELLLNSIDLSRNSLTGEIPKQIGSLLGLVFLNLSRNNLSGEIMYEIGNLKSLEFLDLSRNHLRAESPSSLVKIDSLSVMDLSNNNLIGKIPIGTRLQSFGISSYRGNLDLCGKPLEKECSEDDVPSLLFDNEIEDEESIFYQTFYMSLGIGFGVGLWGFIGPIIFCRSWRYTYIRFLNGFNDPFRIRFNHWHTR